MSVPEDIEELTKDLRGIIAGYCQVDENKLSLLAPLRPGMFFKGESLDLDSLSLLDLAWEIEDRVGVRISEEEMEKVKTVQDLIICVAGIVGIPQR